MWKRQGFLCLALVAAAAPITPGESRLGQPSKIEAFRKLYLSSLEHYGVVGSSILVIEGGETKLRASYGEANQATRQKVDDETTFHWASITKTFTGIAIMQLRDHGLLQLDDPVVKYVPELRLIHDAYGPIEAITIRELMTHSAGFRSPTWPWSSNKDWEPFEPTKWSQVTAMLPYTEILFPPGTRHSYSNLGVVFLGQVIERLSGDDYEVFVDKNILKPLGMSSSYFDRSPYYLLKHRAAGYFRSNGSLKAAPFDFDSGITVSNSGLNAPMPDMERYLRFLIGSRQEEAPKELAHDGLAGRGQVRRGSLSFGAASCGLCAFEQVLKRSSLEEMFQKQMPISQSDPSQGIASGQDWVGLSFFLHAAGDRLYVGHGGQQGGFISHLYFDPVKRNGYIIAFNTDSGDPETNTQQLDRELREHLFHEVFATE